MFRSVWLAWYCAATGARLAAVGLAPHPSAPSALSPASAMTPPLCSHWRASLLGALWGFGHSTGQLILGLLMVVLKDRFTAVRHHD